MPTFDTALWLLGFAAGLGLILTRVARGIAARTGMVDAPDGGRKTQPRPVPVAGGVAVLLAALLSLAVVATADAGVAAALSAAPRRSLALLAAAVLITLVGFADDLYNLRPRYKFLGQFAAILALVLGGDFVIERLGAFGWVAALGPFGVPVTVLWLLGCVNALNLIDGMDGLLGTVGGIALVTLAVMAAVTGNLFAAVAALALAGAVFGFLWWNLPPATVYMGDAGSMLIGLVVGAVAVMASLKGPATVALGAPLAVLVLPFFDTAAAVVRRKLTGRSFAAADRDHMHHRMMRRGLTPPRVLAVVAALGLVAAAGGLATTAWNNDLFAVLAAWGVILALLVGRLFGDTELGLIRARVSGLVRAVLAALGAGAARACGLSARLGGAADWKRVWLELVVRAESLELRGLSLEVNASASHESFRARWSCPAGARSGRVLRMVIPLLDHGDVSLGRLTLDVIRGARPLPEVLESFSGLVDVIERAAAARPMPAVAAVPPAPADGLESAKPLAARA
jgi:UDP-GlcNAc:undecaprenyl-phosphate GlcNAc-1-phosphate transferase